ncbi:hypothetical protein BST27_24955 [Mycobacterium intermedium]|uniref:Methyltransferase putative zinc binding domain-containing protein n=1 Tax=Mycobacterium intermedium TaxID=28445 RepID=A0A1T3W178_MYCIE|nr:MULTISPECIES: methyltransferase domain-containing protein [Mycobacterium]OPE47760.1 hypothetical protein BV508_20890 [Mycobacterium intermedium]ORA96607.1 hypothetical protein BST27_24955 [Mycobacterium intermedium]
MTCRHREAAFTRSLFDLCFTHPSNTYPRGEDLCEPELHYPLGVKVCQRCYLVQIEDYARPDELFSAASGHEKFLPGSHISIRSPPALWENQPDDVMTCRGTSSMRCRPNWLISSSRRCVL